MAIRRISSSKCPGFVRCADRATQQNTSGDCPSPLLTYFVPRAYASHGHLYASALSSCSLKFLACVSYGTVSSRRFSLQGFRNPIYGIRLTAAQLSTMGGTFLGPMSSRLLFWQQQEDSFRPPSSDGAALVLPFSLSEQWPSEECDHCLQSDQTLSKMSREISESFW